MWNAGSKYGVINVECDVVNTTRCDVTKKKTDLNQEGNMVL